MEFFSLYCRQFVRQADGKIYTVTLVFYLTTSFILISYPLLHTSINIILTGYGVDCVIFQRGGDIVHMGPLELPCI